jgi:hypothetical protein
VLRIKTWNDDTTFSHTCIVRVEVLPIWLVDPRREVRMLADNMGTLLRRIGVYT